MTYSEFEDYAEIHDGVTADSIREAAADPQMNTDVIAALASELGEDGQAIAEDIEGDIEEGTRSNATSAQQVAASLARNGYYAVGLLNQFATDVETFDSGVEDLNTRLRTATSSAREIYRNMPDEDVPAYAETWNAEKAKLRPEYERLEEALETAADTVATKFEQGATEDNVRALLVAGLIPLGQASLWPTITLSPADTYSAYQAAVRNGTLPSLDAMTEIDRQNFIDANPGLIESWMQIEDPPPDLVDAIIRLSLPVVTTEDADWDAQQIINQLEDGGNPNLVLEALENVEGINAGMALLMPWAARNGISLGESTPRGEANRYPAVGAAQDYLETFYEQTYPHSQDLVDFINSDEHSWSTSYTVSDGTHYMHYSNDGYSDTERQSLLGAYADGILNLSNEEAGGHWVRLPEELQNDAREVYSWEYSTTARTNMFEDNEGFQALAELLSHGTGQPGDGLAKEMGSTAAASMAAYEQYWADQPGGHRQGSWDPDIAANVFDLVGRNLDASLDLIAGDDVPSQYPENFNAVVFNHPWDLENGNEEKVAGLYANLTPDMDGLDDHERAALTEATRDALIGLSADLTDVDGGNFERLMGATEDVDPEDVVSAAWSNSLLTRELTDAVGANLDLFSAAPGSPSADGHDLSNAERVRLFTFIASDRVGDDPSAFDYNRGAAQLSAYVQAHQQDGVNQYVAGLPQDDRSELAERNGRLQGLLDAGIINEAATRGIVGQDAENERVQNIKTGTALLNQAISITPGVSTYVGPVSGTANTLVNNFLQADDITSPPAELGPNWQPGGSHLSASHSIMLLDALVSSGQVDPADVPAELRPDDGDLSGLSSGAIDDLTRPVLADYFANHPPYDDQVMPGMTDWLTTNYNGIVDHYAMTNPQDILTNPGWDGN